MIQHQKHGTWRQGRTLPLQGAKPQPRQPACKDGEDLHGYSPRQTPSPYGRGRLAMRTANLTGIVTQYEALLENASHWHIDPGAHLVRRCHRLCLADVLRRHLAYAGETSQAHGTDEFVLQDLQH